MRVLAIFALSLLLAAPASAAEPREADLYLFWRIGCQYCEREMAFLDALAQRQPALRVHRFEILREPANRALMAKVADALGAEGGSVPFTVIGGHVIVGYLDDASSGREIEARVRECLARGCADPVKPIIVGQQGSAPGAGARGAPLPARLPEVLHVPLVGEVRTAHLSLPVLTMLLGALDGFNPCAMWVLVFLLGLLSGMRDRTRMWVLGGAFVAASAGVYLLFLTAWLNVLLFFGAITFIRVALGVVALAGGGYYLREFVLNRAAACEITAPEQRQRIFARLRELAQRRDFLVALGGIVALAFAVNLVEFLCSAGIPAVFTQVLALSSLSPLEYAAYLLLYVFVFMLDDLVVLAVALRTLEVTGLTTTYARWSNLAGGSVLLAIGALLILRPEWLSF
jgi:glutaredoxin